MSRCEGPARQVLAVVVIEDVLRVCRDSERFPAVLVVHTLLILCHRQVPFFKLRPQIVRYGVEQGFDSSFVAFGAGGLERVSHTLRTLPDDTIHAVARLARYIDLVADEPDREVLWQVIVQLFQPILYSGQWVRWLAAVVYYDGGIGAAIVRAVE